MAENLDELKEELYEAFNEARTLTKTDLSNASGSSVSEDIASKSHSLVALAATAQAITTVEHEISIRDLVARARANGDSVVLEIGQGLIKDIQSLSTLKLKTPKKE